MTNNENNTPLNTPPANSDTTDNSAYKMEYNLKNANGNETVVKSMSLEENIQDIRIGIGKVRKQYKNGNITKEEKRTLMADLKERRENSKRSLLSFATTKAIIDDHLENGNFNNSPSNMKYADFLMAIQANGEPNPNTGNKAIQGFDNKGNMMFSYVDGKGELIKDEYGNNISITSGQAKNLITTVYDKGRTVIEEIGINSDKNGSTAAWTTNDDAATKHKVNTIVGNDVNNFNDLKAYPVRGVVGGQESTATLEGYLNGADLSASDLTDQMWSVLSQDTSLLAKIGVEDKDNDGLNKGDFATPENMKKLVDAIIRHDDPGFNLQTSKSILAEFVNSQAKSLHDNKWNASPLNKNSANFVTPKSTTSGTEKERQIANALTSFNSLVEEKNFDEPITVGEGQAIKLVDKGNGKLGVELMDRDDNGVVTRSAISIDQAYKMLSPNQTRAIKGLGSDVYNQFSKDNKLSLERLISQQAFNASDDAELIGALSSSPDLKGFKFSNPSSFSNSVKIYHKASKTSKTFDVDDKQGMQEFINENRIVDFT